MTETFMQIRQNKTADTHSDYVFSYKFNRIFPGTKLRSDPYWPLNDQLYARLNFTDFLKATNLTLNPDMVQC